MMSMEIKKAESQVHPFKRESQLISLDLCKMFLTYFGATVSVLLSVVIFYLIASKAQETVTIKLHPGSESSEGTISNPGNASSSSVNNTIVSCPSFDQAYDPKTRKCYRAGLQERGPCGELMAFLSASEDGKGECKCSLPRRSCGKPLSYWKPHDRCYELYTQGPCQEDEWLVETGNNTLNCIRNLCQVQLLDEDDGRGDGTKEIFTFEQDGVCYRTESQAFCGWNQVARFVLNQPRPGCYNEDDDSVCLEYPPPTFSVSATVSCPIGFISDAYGDCHVAV